MRCYNIRISFIFFNLKCFLSFSTNSSAVITDYTGCTAAVRRSFASRKRRPGEGIRQRKEEEVVWTADSRSDG